MLPLKYNKNGGHNERCGLVERQILFDKCGIARLGRGGIVKNSKENLVH